MYSGPHIFKIMAADPHIHIPRSVVGWFDAIFALPVILGAFFAFRSLPYEQLPDTAFAIFLVLSLVAVMGPIEILRAPWRTLPPSNDRWGAILARALIKLVGFFAALCALGFLYWLFPEYDRAYYTKFFEAARMILPWLPVICVPYFIYVEWRLPKEKGGTWECAMFALGKWDEIDWNTLGQYALGWLVKGFFLPIMFTDVANNIGHFRAANWDLIGIGFVSAFNLLFSAIIHLELVFVTAGYVFACRIFDSHIRAVEKTLFGWVIAVMSYSPFLGLVYVRYLDYSIEGSGWLNWLGGHPLLVVMWGSLILALVVLHLWCDAIFGLRFSNLTHRGIITNGPYRFSKHPAYVIKNLRWWLVSVPFIALSWEEAIRLSLLLLLVNLVYTIRSYAEERMLSQDPTYVAYARWMERHGLLRFLARRFKFFSYEWRLARWRAQGYVPPENEAAKPFV